jgi:hypothetical protein
MGNEDTYEDEPLFNEKPKGSGPIAQEKRKGHNLMKIGTADAFVEVSKFKGKVYAQFRFWFRSADDGTWYRTKKGVNLEVSAFKDFVHQLVKNADAMLTFVESEEADPYEADE